ncbi:MAG: hypothetical protein JSW61_05820 [Candidatus Thorarchaeota archaeon]|nr:MAG: hypothetical protein JSW61_05820 [Candidatus Thorarchaeota archaeon]
MVEEIRKSLVSESNECYQTQEEAIRGFWRSLGIRDMDRLSREAPELYEKIRRVEGILLNEDDSSTDLE